MILIFLFATLFITLGVQTPDSSSPSDMLDGISLVAPPRPFQTNPMTPIKAVGADWVAVIPYGFSRLGEPRVNYNQFGGQWWGERPDGCLKTLEIAKQNDMRVMLKPQVYVPGSWPGDIEFQQESDWQTWERSYEAFILPMADMAEAQSVELLCIGTEFKISSVKREAFWRTLIEKIRTRYSGQLTYAANWDEYTKIKWWDAVDYIGVDAYFPLVEDALPSVSKIKTAWLPHQYAMQRVQRKFNKPVIFTEYGYLSVDHCASKNWILEGQLGDLAVNEQAQANALEAMYAVFGATDWWKGGFLWKWFHEMPRKDGHPTKGYDPQGKLAEQTIKKWYSKW